MPRTPGQARLGRFGALALVMSWGFVLLGGCGTVPVNADRAAFAALPSRNAVPRAPVTIDPANTVLLDVRLDRQVAVNGCGAHAVAAVVNYWMQVDRERVRGPAPRGIDIYAGSPPTAEAGYSLADVVALLERQGLVAVVVTTTVAGVRDEVDAGRPAIVRVSLPAAYLRTAALFPTETPVAGPIEAAANDLSGRILEPVSIARLDHYWIVMGYDAGRVIVLDPALGIRAIERAAFERAFQRGGTLAVVIGGWA